MIKLILKVCEDAHKILELEQYLFFAVMYAITVKNRMFRFWNTRHMKEWRLSKSQKLLKMHSKNGTSIKLKLFTVLANWQLQIVP